MLLFLYFFLSFFFLLRPDRERKKGNFFSRDLVFMQSKDTKGVDVWRSRLEPRVLNEERINAIIAFALLRQTLGLGELRLLK